MALCREAVKHAISVSFAVQIMVALVYSLLDSFIQPVVPKSARLTRPRYFKVLRNSLNEVATRKTFPWEGKKGQEHFVLYLVNSARDPISLVSSTWVSLSAPESDQARIAESD